MGPDIVEIEDEFRSSWRAYEPLRYREFLCRVLEQDRLELLARLIGAEIEFSFQPPEGAVPSDSTATAEDVTSEDEDDERIRPSLSILLIQNPELRQRGDLVMRLCVLEYALRLQHDHIAPHPESYLQLCPDSQDHLYQLLQRTEDRLPVRHARKTPVKTDDSTVRDESKSSSISLDLLPNNLGCFLLIDLISRGGMGFVYSAIDLRSAAPVAVKVMRRDDSWSIYRFIEEFSWLSQLNHPNLVRLYDACSEGDFRYFSMELVEGKNVFEWFQLTRRHRKTPWPALKKVLIQAASAIQFLHDQGAIHCDIKCSNLMITARRRAVLLDLGLAIRSGSCESGLGTLQYTAPEIVAAGQHSTASDWYSFGVMIYELLAGDFALKTIPAPADSAGYGCRVDLCDLRGQVADADPVLVDLCCDLLAADPEARPSGCEVLRRLGGSMHPNFAAEHFVGREEFLSELSNLHEKSRIATRPMAAIIHGESGIGKTTSIRRWLSLQERSDELVISVRCFRQDQTPLRLMNGIVQQLVQVLSALPPSYWKYSLEPHLDEISQSFPQVRQLVDEGFDFKARPRGSTSNQSEGHGVRKLIQWMLELNQDRRFLIVVDDAQWADSKSLWWLAELFQSPNYRGFFIGIDEGNDSYIATSMKGEAASHLESLPGEQSRHSTTLDLIEVELPPFPAELANQLLSDWAGQNDLAMTPSVKDNIRDRSHGNPFLLRELFLAYAYYAKRDSISDEEWLGRDSGNSLRRRFSLLPIQAENVLQYLAIAGQPLGFHQLQIVSRILPDDLQRTLNLLESQGWVHSSFKDLRSDIEISHDKFRKAILASMPIDRVQRRHYRMARMLSSEVPPPWSRMGEHYWHAEQYREAAACFLQAAHQAIGTGSYREALQFLSRATHQDADRSPEEIEKVAMMEADCLAAVGNSAEAALHFEQLHESVADKESKLLYRCLAGEQWIRAGQLDRGLSHLEQTLKRLGITRIRHSRYSHLALRAKILLHHHSDSPRLARNGQSLAFGPLNQTLSRLSIPLTFLDNQLGPDLILQFKKHSKLEGSIAEQATSIVHYGMLLSFGKRQWLKPALRWVRIGRHLARRSGSPSACGSLYLTLFAMRVQQGKIRQAKKYADRSILCYRRDVRSKQWELQFANWAVLGCHWSSMHLRLLRENCLELRRSAEERSDPMSKFFMHVAAAHWSDLAVNDVAGARRALAIAGSAISNQSFQSPRYFLWLSQIKQALYEGRPREANRLLERDWAQLRKAYLFGTNHYRWLALCLRLCCQLTLLRQAPNRSGQAQILRQAHKSVRMMLALEHPPFVAYGKGFQMVVRAADGDVAAFQAWKSIVQELDGYGHHLYANALRWHQELGPGGCPSSTSSARDRFLAEGCPAPERLMDVLIPLPNKPTGS